LRRVPPSADDERTDDGDREQERGTGSPVRASACS
jgi:hypothetical protein